MREAGVEIREAGLADLPAINGIYNHYVLNSTCTYQEEPSSREEREAWFKDHSPLHPITVAVKAGEVLAWASASPFKLRAAYRHTVENSVYVHPDWQGKGLGSALLEDLLRRCSVHGHHRMVAMISSDQAPSLALHQRFGFSKAGELSEVGRKFGRWLGVTYMEKQL